MTIARKLTLIAALPVLVIAAAIIIETVAYLALRNRWQEASNASGIEARIFAIGTLACDYIRHREPRAAEQWRRQAEELNRQFVSFDAGEIAELRKATNDVNAYFDSLVAQGTPLDAVSRERQSWIASRLTDGAQQAYAEASAIRDSALAGLSRSQLGFAFQILGILGIAFAIIAGVAAITARQVSTSLQRLRQAANAIASGNLDYRADAATNDEQGVLEAFAYSASHVLRAPLRAIDGFSRILMEEYAGNLDAEGHRLLGVVRGGTKEMAQYIDDVLAFSRIGRVAMDIASVDMEMTVRAILAGDLAPLCEGRRLTINVEPLPAARGDPAMLREVWLNLLDNAIKFSRSAAEGRIEIGATAGNGETIYRVRDNGAGFDMQYAGKLFGVFQRLHGAEFPGTGIGLAIVRRIITRHGGRVWAEGKPGEGATFYFTLPKEETTHA